MSKVNLDALIPREDFEVMGGIDAQRLTDRLKISDLIKGEGFFYSSLRKPDFQRETSDWDKNKIADFIKSFIDGDLIPSIILWSSGKYTFVIDGAHRLGALIAWANNDYGSGLISQAFFGHEIDSEQKKIAEQTERLVNQRVGAYANFAAAIKSPNEANPEVLAIAQKLGVLSLQLQWVTGSALKAEQSFFTINQKATPISDTEIELLKARGKPYAMASRAIIRSGTGHKYWSKFDETVQKNIEELAKEINDSLFDPALKTPVKTLDLPLAGKGYSSKSLPLIFDLVKLTNDVSGKEIQEDSDGQDTIDNLKNTNKIIRRFTTTHPSSLGLHPAVYFYSEKGRYQPTAFLAWVDMIKEFEAKNLFNDFTSIREQFEEFTINNKHISNQVTVKYGSSLKGHKQLKEVYMYIIEKIKLGILRETLLAEIKKDYSYLNIDYRGEKTKSSDFNESTKSEIFIKEAIANAPKCKICKGLVHTNSITIDHIIRKQDGGIGIVDNGQISHPFCNSTYKN